MAEQIKLEQALFGYRDGHNLLGTSTPLTPDVRQFLATVTDSSGPECPNGFETVITGLPLPKTDFYAVFATWPAPEMPRPGCVWSHVILIQLPDLARIPALGAVGRFFCRPSSLVPSSAYQRPIILDDHSLRNRAAHPADARRMLYLLQILYDHFQGPVVVLDEMSAVWETALFRIWSQQWPRLRRQFAFSTGSLADRSLTGLGFDIQIAPVSTERLWRRTETPVLLLDYRAPVEIRPRLWEATWLNLAWEDLQDDSRQSLRRFFFEYGSDIERPRAAFAKLAAIYQELNISPDPDWSRLLISVGEAFPRPDEAVRLKRSLASLPKNITSGQKLQRAWAIASVLLDSRWGSRFPKVEFDFAEAAAELWKDRREQTVELLSRLVQKRGTPAASSFAKGVASAIDTESLKSIAETNTELIPIILRHNPNLAFDISTWKLSGHVQTQVFETLSRLSLPEEAWAKIIGAMFISATYVSVREAVAMAGQRAMAGAFRWLEHPISHEVVPSQTWRDALASTATETLTQTDRLTPAQFALTTWCVPPKELRQILSAERNDVQRVAAESPESIPSPLRGSTAFLLLTLGLRGRGEPATRLILWSFYAVHEALATGLYSSESWWLLAPELPDIGFWRDWDRCKKLRRAVNSFLTNDQKNRKNLSELATTVEQRKIAQILPEEEDDSTPEFLD